MGEMQIKKTQLPSQVVACKIYQEALQKEIFPLYFNLFTS